MTDFSLPFLAAIQKDQRLLIDDARSQWCTARELAEQVEQWVAVFAGVKRLAFHYIGNRVEHVAAFLGLLKAGHGLALLDPAMSVQARQKLEETYRPDIIVNPVGSVTGQIGGLVYSVGASGAAPLHPDLAVLLSTSGSTGNPKFVRLTLGNLQSNAVAIAAVLDIRSDEVGLAHLPLHYSYGLSILTSHLCRAAPVMLTERGFMDAAFWPRARELDVAHFPGVPFHYQMLRRLGLARVNLPKLRVMTQAGGALDFATRQHFHDAMSARGGRFHVMYGQTEASPRITTMSHEDFVVAPQSVGQALPGGHIEIAADTGEIIYRGPNVMQGYAHSRSDLALGDTQHGELRTGDIGQLDAAGRLTITGRLKREGKVAGLRINLDDVERAAASVVSGAAVVQRGEYIVVYCPDVGARDDLKLRIIDTLASTFTIPRLSYKVEFLNELPRTPRGKIDYAALEAAS